MLSSSDRFFQTRPCTIMIQNSSKKIFHNSPLARSEKPFHGLVLNHYGTGTRLKKSVGLLEHTVIPHCSMLTPLICSTSNSSSLFSTVSIISSRYVKDLKPCFSTVSSSFMVGNNLSFTSEEAENSLKNWTF